MARDAGLSDIEIAWIAWGPDAPTWSTPDAAVLRAVDEILLHGSISDPTWAALSENLTSEQVLDVIFTAGSYAMLAAMVSSLGIELDEDLRSAVAVLTDPSP
jgi:alkylhydroperoxidase family enzyme